MSTNKNVILYSSVILLIVVLVYFAGYPISSRNRNRISQYFETKKILPFQGIKKNPKKLIEYPFSPGERFRYGIYSMGLKVGETLITYLGRQELDGLLKDVIVVESRAPGFSDVEKIYGDIDSFTPTRVERKIRLFGENIQIVEEYNEEKKEVVITRKAKKTTVKKITSDQKIGNVILLLYHFRYKKDKYKIGDKITFNLPTKRLEMLIDKQTEIKVPAGRFASLFVRSTPSHFKIWFSNDTDRVPLRIQGAIGFGNAYLDFIDSKKPK